jgi:LysR family hydrogen peroxide-inducible transcriptional activator
LHLVIAPDHPIDDANPAAPHMLAGCPLLTVDPRHHLARQAADVAAHYGMAIAPSRYGISLHQMVARGLRFTLLSGLGILSVPRLGRSLVDRDRLASPVAHGRGVLVDHR